ncbi:PREDICTED: wiskott-Aldrich syndrome protein homolog [Priapulus caudatus]|uniref:Wiskott-Aldrich syndrome protein homolog n=1 Tax=Priapulus caudatus TaxID=37621 RepID=A0ABM1F2W3_PRICU|nr:PREDICTED: wiskott-Aldrich syndrome protein homolog [Priapulus caudatus]
MPLEHCQDSTDHNTDGQQPNQHPASPPSPPPQTGASTPSAPPPPPQTGRQTACGYATAHVPSAPSAPPPAPPRPAPRRAGSMQQAPRRMWVRVCAVGASTIAAGVACECELCAAGPGESALPAPPQPRTNGVTIAYNPYAHPGPDTAYSSDDDTSPEDSDDDPWSPAPPPPDHYYNGRIVGTGANSDPILYEFVVGEDDDPVSTTFNPQHVRQMAVAAIFEAISRAAAIPNGTGHPDDDDENHDA